MPCVRDFVPKAEHRRRIADAESELGVATLDGLDRAQATDKLQAARDDARRVEAAIAEVDRREREAWQDAWKAAVSAERLRGYLWMIEYLDRVTDYLRAQEAADEAADRLRALEEVASIVNFQNGLWGLATETLYDIELLQATAGRLPSEVQMAHQTGNPPFAHLTLEECERLRKKAESLAANEKVTRT
jgi:hypothetical protein